MEYFFEPFARLCFGFRSAFARLALSEELKRSDLTGTNMEIITSIQEMAR